MIYTLYCLPLLSDYFQKGLVKSMIIEREFSKIENETDRNFRKRHRLYGEDYYKARFEK